MSVPARFSTAWWAWIASTGFTCGAVVVVVLYLTGELADIQYIWAFVIGATVGDLVLALCFEAVAPTHVTVGPGERIRNDSPLQHRAKVVSEFSADGTGKVSVRGEVWNARCTSLSAEGLSPGQQVSIIGRDGLTLLIDDGGSDT